MLLYLLSFLISGAGANSESSDPPLTVTLTDGQAGKCFLIATGKPSAVTPYRCHFGGTERMLFRQKSQQSTWNANPPLGTAPGSYSSPEYDWTMIGPTEKTGTPRTFPVQQIVEKGKTTIVPPPGLMADVFKSGSGASEESLTVETLALNIVLQQVTMLAAKEPEIFASGELASFKKQTLTSVQRRLEAIQKIFSDRQETVIRLQTGQVTRCRRGASLDVKPRFPTFASGQMVEKSCPFWTCDDVRIDGKTYSAVLRQEDEPNGFVGPQLMLSNASGLAPIPVIESAEVPSGSGTVKTYQLPKGSLAYNSGGGYGAVSPEPREEKTFSKKRLEKSKDAYRFLSGPMSMGLFKGENQFCNDPKVSRALSQLEKSRQRMEDDILRAKTVELIDLSPEVLQMGFGSAVSAGETRSAKAIRSRTVEKKLLPEDACRLSKGVYYRPEVAERLDEIKRTMSEPSEDALTEDEVAELFKEIAAMPDIPFRYTRDGCYARAHVITHRLKERGIEPEKIWAFGDLFPKAVKDLRWRYHVAPVVSVKGPGGKIRRIVIDPALADRPLEVSEWLTTFSPRGKKQWMEATFPPPWDAGSRGKIAVSFTNPEIYWPDLTPKDPKKSFDQATATNAEYLRALETNPPSSPSPR